MNDFLKSSLDRINTQAVQYDPMKKKMTKNSEDIIFQDIDTTYKQYKKSKKL